MFCAEADVSIAHDIATIREDVKSRRAADNSKIDLEIFIMVSSLCLFRTM
jgi:hypothetical protein